MYDERVKAALDALGSWERQDDGKPLDFVVASALTTWEANTTAGPWYVVGETWISRAEYVAYRILKVIERGHGSNLSVGTASPAITQK